MKALFVLIFLAIGICAGEVPAEVKLIDGRVLSGVTLAKIEADGRLNVVHADGMGRYAAKDISEESRLALGMGKTQDLETQETRLDVMKGETVLKTLTGREYTGVKDVKVTAAHLSFSHEAGLARVLIKDLPEEIRSRCEYDEAKAVVLLAKEREANQKTEQYLDKQYAAYEAKQALTDKEAARAQAQEKRDAVWAKLEKENPLFRGSGNSSPARPQYLLNHLNVDQWVDYYLYNPNAQDYSGPLGNGSRK